MNRKQLVASILGLAVVLCAPVAVAEAKEMESAILGGVSVSAQSKISASGASCSTSAGGTAVVSVSGTYYYVNVDSMEIDSASSANGGQHGKEVSFSAPTGCRSVKVQGSHSVVCGNQRWSASTSAIY